MTTAAAPRLSHDDPAYFARLAAVDQAHWWSRGMWRLASHWLDAALAGRSGLRALDVGCGAGLTAARLAARPEVAEVIGVEPSPAALRHAQALPLRLVRGSALDLPLGDATVDVLTCFDVFQHLTPRGDRRAAAEAARVLTPGGVAVVRCNGRGWSGDDSTYRLDDLAGVLAGAGLEVRRASYANCIPALAQELRGRLPRARAAGAAHPSGGGLQIAPRPGWVNRVMGAVSQSEAFAAGRLGVRLPFGHSTLVLAVRPVD